MLLIDLCVGILQNDILLFLEILTHSDMSILLGLVEVEVEEGRLNT